PTAKTSTPTNLGQCNGQRKSGGDTHRPPSSNPKWVDAAEVTAVPSWTSREVTVASRIELAGLPHLRICLLPAAHPVQCDGHLSMEIGPILGRKRAAGRQRFLMMLQRLLRLA